MSTDLTLVDEAAKLAALNITLPKWPQMLVWGTTVRQAQAKNIILKTDPVLTSLSPYSGGNNHSWNEWARKKLGLSLLAEFQKKHPELDDTFCWDVERELKEILGCVSTDYVDNNWASCNFIYGPHGWMHPNGVVGYIDNVGKWPEAAEVYEDWCTLAKAFPFLELHATLMSDSDSDADTTQPLVTFIVRDGLVHVAPEAFVPAFEVAPRRRIESLSHTSLTNSSREQGLPDSYIEEYALIVKPAMEQALNIAYQKRMSLPAPSDAAKTETAGALGAGTPALGLDAAA